MNEIDQEIFYISDLLDRGQGRAAAERLREDAQYFRPQTMKNIIDGVYNTERPNQGADISITEIQDNYRGGYRDQRYREPEYRVTIQTPEYRQTFDPRDPRGYDPRDPRGYDRRQQYQYQQQQAVLRCDDIGVIGMQGFRPLYRSQPYYMPLRYEQYQRW